MYSKATTIAIRARSAKLVVLGLHKRVVTLQLWRGGVRRRASRANWTFPDKRESEVMVSAV
jgi:hypothetical protein